MRRARRFGAEIKLRAVPLPNGKTSHNVIVIVPGASARTIVLGAHMDSKAPSPGANDNGSGCGVLVELVRCLRVSPARPTVKIVFFGAEEMIDADPDHHHFGSRYYVRHMSPLARRRLVGMISVDMVGYGGSFVVRSMGEGPRTMVNLLQRRARARGVELRYLADPSPVGWSDHEAFERAGYPAAWLEWRNDPVYHTAADTSAHLVKSRLRTTGGLLLAFLYGLGDDELAVLGDDRGSRWQGISTE
jgi:Zn-dependent M28 family amino/carboxypeptidase